ncbi:hypothetical protein BGZ60DRAFT_400443 [Tricladium varicosporioides]|nr:hypothetical protein BGZ60DRAFT_400443 [Hymenoscyphus varicosporioides]
MLFFIWKRRLMHRSTFGPSCQVFLGVWYILLRDSCSSGDIGELGRYGLIYMLFYERWCSVSKMFYYYSPRAI